MKTLSDETIANAAKEYALQFMDGLVGQDHIVDACIAVGKWVRDQMPKPMTLDDWGWKVCDPKHNEITCKTPFGTYVILYKTRIYFAGHTEYEDPIPCDNIEHGKLLAKEDYERKLDECQKCYV